MPVTGEIAELPLPELLNMMRHRAGTVKLLATPQVSEMVLHFTPGYLCGFQANNRILKSEAQVVDKLVGVTASPAGRFVFEPKHASSLMGSVRMNIDRLALILVSKVDEIAVNKANLPAPHRIFRAVPPEQQPQPPPAFEEADLADFFHNAETLLRCGISAEKLASIEQISVPQVQVYLYKLSLLGIVAPARRDDLWAELDRVLEAKSTPLRLNAEMNPDAVPAAPAGGADPKRLRVADGANARPIRPIRSTELIDTAPIGLGKLAQRKITRLTGSREDEEDDLPPAA